jgi:hypothetical protein
MRIAGRDSAVTSSRNYTDTCKGYLRVCARVSKSRHILVLAQRATTIRKPCLEPRARASVLHPVLGHRFHAFEAAVSVNHAVQ